MDIAVHSAHKLRPPASDGRRSRRDISGGSGKAPLGRTTTCACACRDKALHALSTRATQRSARNLTAGLTHDTKLSTRPGGPAKCCREPHAIASGTPTLCRHPMAMSNALPPGPSRSPALSPRSRARSRPFPSSGSSRPTLTAIPRRISRPVSPSYIFDADAVSLWTGAVEDGNSAGQGENPPQGSAPQKGVEVADSRPNTKRQLTLTATHGGNGEDDFDDGRGNRDELKRIKRSSNGIPMLACPFYKHDPVKYGVSRVCAGPGWTTTHRVKEHVFRRHRKSGPQCDRCFERFDNETALQFHLAPTTCTRQTQVPTNEDVNVRQEKELRKRKQRGLKQTEKERWDEMYSILFPNQNIPSCYYQDEPLDVENGRLEQYAIATVPNKVLEKLGDMLSSAGMQHTVREAVKSSLEACFRDFREQPTEPCEEVQPEVPSNPPGQDDPTVSHLPILDPAFDFLGGWDNALWTVDPSMFLNNSLLEDEFNASTGAALDTRGSNENMANSDKKEQFDESNPVSDQQAVK